MTFGRHGIRSARLAGSLLAAAFLTGCSASNDEDSAGGCFLCSVDASPDVSGDRTASDGGTDAAAQNRNPLCGVGLCDPDWTGACVETPLPSDAAGASDGDSDESRDGAPDDGDARAGDHGSESEAARDDASGQNDDGAPGAEEDATDTLAPVADGAGADEGADAQDGDADSEPGPARDSATGDGASPLDTGKDAVDAGDAEGNGLACHIRWSNGATIPRGLCEPAGEKGTAEACSTPSDCLPGMTCVYGFQGGECRPYCCDDPESCPHATFCSTRPPYPAVASSGQAVPVCVPIMPCTLLAGPLEGCQPNTACTIVRADGTTSCDVAGLGMRGDPCPCADGFVCGKAANQCLKICRVADASTDCPAGTCQAGTSSFPPGFGVCIGGSLDSGSN